MSKFFFLIVFLSLQVYASGSSDLLFQRADAKVASYRLVHDGKKIHLNGITLSRFDLARNQSYISELFKRPTANKKGSCRQGRFVHTVTSKKGQISHHGCMSEPYFHRVYDLFRHVALTKGS